MNLKCHVRPRNSGSASANSLAAAFSLSSPSIEIEDFRLNQLRAKIGISKFHVSAFRGDCRRELTTLPTGLQRLLEKMSLLIEFTTSHYHHTIFLLSIIDSTTPRIPAVRVIEITPNTACSHPSGLWDFVGSNSIV